MYPLGIRSFLLYILVKNTLQPQAKSLFHVTNHSITRKWGREKVFSKSKTESCQEQFAYFSINLLTVSVEVFLKNFNTSIFHNFYYKACKAPSQVYKNFTLLPKIFLMEAFAPRAIIKQ